MIYHKTMKSENNGKTLTWKAISFFFYTKLFLGLFEFFWPIQTFFQKSCFTTFLTLWLANFVQKIRKKLMSQLWDLQFQTDKWTHRAKLIWHFCLSWASLQEVTLSENWIKQNMPQMTSNLYLYCKIVTY